MSHLLSPPNAAQSDNFDPKLGSKSNSPLSRLLLNAIRPQCTTTQPSQLPINKDDKCNNDQEISVSKNVTDDQLESPRNEPVRTPISIHNPISTPPGLNFNPITGEKPPVENHFHKLSILESPARLFQVKSVNVSPTMQTEGVSKLELIGCNKVSEIVAKTIDANIDNIAVNSSVRNFRTVRDNSMNMVITLKNSRTGEEIIASSGYYMKPGFRMQVRWALNSSDILNCKQDNLAIGLFRYGFISNHHPIVAKKILSGEVYFNGNITSGNLLFFAPKAAGTFVYRLFNQENVETATDTLSYSTSFVVVLMDGDLVNNMKFLSNLFEEREIDSSASASKVLIQFLSFLQGIRPHTNFSADVVGQLGKCVEEVLAIFTWAMIAIEKIKQRESDEKKDEASEGQIEIETGVADEEEKRQKILPPSVRSMSALKRIHADLYDIFLVLHQNKVCWYALSQKVKNIIQEYVNLFCPILRRFFSGKEALQEARFLSFGFQLSPQENNRLITSKEILRPLDLFASSFALTLFPPNDFESKRIFFLHALQDSLLNTEALPFGAKLKLYGSSSNNFGSESADMDVCVVLAEGSAGLQQEEKMQLIKRISDCLQQLDMREVSTRLTARIPIVLFKHPSLSYEGDISVHNPLALANTRLLRTYSLIDTRVRSLVFLVKHWAKQRHMNSPSSGTLSSYGFILSVIHFLQTRPVPLLPSLQELPSNWTGSGTNIDPHNDPLSVRGWGEIPLEKLPRLLAHTANDNRVCNIYFLDPSSEQLQLLQKYAARNQESLAQLLISYFEYYAWNFDFKKHVISVRSPSKIIRKVDKAESCAWLPTDTISIEDPFEVWYDVAHVVKNSHMNYIKAEFLRAYTLATRIGSGKPLSSLKDCLPSSLHPAEYINELCKACEEPNFARAASKANI